MELIDKEALRKDLIEKGFLPAIVARAIDRAPTVDTKIVLHGRWICDNPNNPVACKLHYECSLCGREVWVHYGISPKKQYPYCHCGAKMDLEDSEEFE